MIVMGSTICELSELDRPPTLGAAAADAIRNAILRGDLKPGEPLREEKLSRSLSVSRGTVREAQRVLENEGLVEVIPRRGAFVARLSPRTVTERYTLRSLLEPYAVRLALEDHAYSDQDLESLDALLVRMGEFEQAGDLYATVKADLEFHYEMCKPSGHSLLLEVLKNLQSLTRLCMVNVKLYRTDLAPDEVQHRQIFDAIRLGDREQAEAVLRGHLDFFKHALLATMAEAEWVGVNGGETGLERAERGQLP